MLKPEQWQLLLPEILWQTAASSGPGGQNVNKTATKTQLRWHVASSRAVSEADKLRLAQALATRITSEGYLMLDVTDTRSQLQNKHLGLERLHDLIATALTPAKPRLITRIPKRAKLQRLDNKRLRGRVKHLRRPIAED